MQLDSLPSRSNPGQYTVLPIEYEARETTSGLIEAGWTSGTHWTEAEWVSESAWTEAGWVSESAEVGWVSESAWTDAGWVSEAA